MRNERSTLKDRRVARNVVPNGRVQPRRVAFLGGFAARGKSDSSTCSFTPAEKSLAVSLKLFPGIRLESTPRRGCIRVSADRSYVRSACGRNEKTGGFSDMPRLRASSAVA